VVAVEREARDEFLILASAALWEKLTPAAPCAHVQRRLGRTSRVTMPWEPRITDLEEELTKKALHAGCQDNVSDSASASSCLGTSGLQGMRRLPTSDVKCRATHQSARGA
jgi:serine/threonine protein phosphatase PrpC